MSRLLEKVAVVTGAGQGIGEAIALRLAREGAYVAVLDWNESAATHTAETIIRQGGKATPFVSDVRQREHLQTIVMELLAVHHKIDILVNNAGVIRDGFLHQISEEDWDLVLDTNLKGPFLCSQAVSAVMKDRQCGKIVNIISRSWLGNVGQSNYSASKGGLVSLTRTLALELARYQIQVNGVAPGLIDTPMTRGLPEKARERLLKMQPTGKMGTVEDIAAAVAFLVSDEASFITGQILHVDGGKSCGLLSL